MKTGENWHRWRQQHQEIDALFKNTMKGYKRTSKQKELSLRQERLHFVKVFSMAVSTSNLLIRPGGDDMYIMNAPGQKKWICFVCFLLTGALIMTACGTNGTTTGSTPATGITSTSSPS